MRRTILASIVLFVCVSGLRALTNKEIAQINNEALDLQLRGEYLKAASMLHRALDATGPESSQRINILHNLGAVYHDLRQYAKSRAYFEESLSLNDRLKVFEDTAQTFAYLASLARLEGDIAESLRYINLALDLRKRLYGEAHWLYATTLCDAGQLDRFLGHFDQAEKKLEQAMEIFGATIGRGHPYADGALFHLAETYRQHGRYEDALSMYQEAIRSITKNLGPDHPRLSLVYLGASKASAKLKRKADAKSYERLARSTVPKSPETHGHTVDVNSLLPRK